jgi:hypothetical protein
MVFPAAGQQIGDSFKRSSVSAVTTNRAGQRWRNILVSASETRSSASTIQLIHSSSRGFFNFFSSVKTRSRNSFMTS